MPAYAGVVNINTASQAQLETLKGIGPTYAARIIAYRREHGSFATIEEIQEVKGIGPATFAAIKDSLSLDYVPPAPKPASAPAPAPKVAQAVVPVAQAHEPAQATQEPVVPRQEPMEVAASQAPAFPLWASIIGLAGIIGLGVLSARFARQHKAAGEETMPLAGEFTIE